MDEDFEYEMEEEPAIRGPKRYLRNVMDPFEFYNDAEFKMRFRFEKDSVLQVILPKVEQFLAKPNHRGLPVPPVLQLLVCLRFYATGSFQMVIGDLCSLSQSTVSRVVVRVSRILAMHIKDNMKMPTTEHERAINVLLFEELGRSGNPNNPVIPGVEGAIDCTHVRLCSTRFGNHAEAFRNRKNYFSLNVQAVAGPKGEFLDIVASWAGSEHDSRIFQNSRIHARYIAGEFTGCLLGDAGYSCQRILLTPVANPLTPAEHRYNRTHKKVRSVVERMFGIWKRRFPCLSLGLRNKLETVPNIIVACAVLHNISMQVNDNPPADDPDLVILPDEPVPVPTPEQQPGGLAFRRELINRVFRRPDDEL